MRKHDNMHPLLTSVPKQVVLGSISEKAIEISHLKYVPFMMQHFPLSFLLQYVFNHTLVATQVVNYRI